MARIVVAIGGNALGDNPDDQVNRIRQATTSLADLVEEGHEVVFTHGNGPQVGVISSAFEKAHEVSSAIPAIALPECTAMSQGYIGYHLQQQLGDELRRRGISKPVISVVTQVEVDPRDLAFSDPTKPIGLHVDEATAATLMSDSVEPPIVYKEDSGRGWRRVVASPKPISIIESETVSKLVDEGVIVIACGGGGIPVVRSDDSANDSDRGNSRGNTGFRGIPAVIDKDLASKTLAEAINADTLVIATTVPNVMTDFHGPQPQLLHLIDADSLEQLIAEGQFAEGSMLPKVQAAIEFARSSRTQVGSDGRREAIICSLGQIGDAVAGNAGTHVRG